MIVDCENGQRLFESRDMGTTWTEAIGTLSGVWTNSRLGVFREENLPVEAPITANIEGVKVMLYTWKRTLLGGEKGKMCSIFGSRKITARFLLDRLPWIITWKFSTPCCTRMVRCTFYGIVLLKQATPFHLSY
ncbi:putative trans-sialidase [Trypanosoma cruzi]|nr:putative trans-sialidase [Trypanosoma cruzi]